MCRGIRSITVSTALALACCLSAVAHGQLSRLSLSDDDADYIFSSHRHDSHGGAPAAHDAACCESATSTWVRGEYLMWWTKGNDLPAMVTTSPAGTPAADIGILGLSTTTTLFGGDQIDKDDRSGLRLTVGHWLDDAHSRGIEVVYFSVFDDDGSGDFSQSGTGGTPNLTIPYFDIAPGSNAEAVFPVSFAAVADGSIDISSSSELHSAAVLLRKCYREGPLGRVDMLGGYRYFRYREGLLMSLDVTQQVAFGGQPPGTNFDIIDHFVTENDFHGGEFGLNAQLHRGGLTVDLLAKVAIGNLNRTVRVDGSSTATTPAPVTTSTTSGGLFTQPTNIRTASTNDFAALPEFGINLSYAASDCVTLNVGYTLLMLNDVVRTGDQIDRVLNSTQFSGGALIGDARPQLAFSDSDFWAQGISFGVLIER